MRKDIDAWCRQCEGCAISRGPPSRPHGHLRKVSAGAPMDLVAIISLSGLPATADSYKYLLVATDYFTKWLEAIPLCDAEAPTCMHALYRAYFSRFGLPRQLHSHQGSNFESKFVAELCSITGIKKREPRRFTLGLMARPSGRIGQFSKCSAPRSMSSPSHGQIACPHCWRHIV